MYGGRIQVIVYQIGDTRKRVKAGNRLFVYMRDVIQNFHEVSFTAISEIEVLAAFWVTFEIDNKPTQEANMFLETFRKELAGWKLIRSYVESSISKRFVTL